MKEYQPFAISNFRTGFDEAVEPWLLPKDAYQLMVNAHLYRGVLEKVLGYTLYANMTYRIIESLGVPDGIKVNFTGTLSHLPVTDQLTAFATVIRGTSAVTLNYDVDSSATVVHLQGPAGNDGTVDITTGDFDFTFASPPPANGDVFIIYDFAPTSLKAIMGIKQYFASNSSQEILVFDQKRIGKVVGLSGIMAAAAGTVQAVSEIQHDYYESDIITLNNATLVYNGTLVGHPFVPGTLKWIEYQSSGALAATPRTITDNGFGGLTGTNVDAANSFIDYLTGVYQLTLTAGPVTGDYFDSTVNVYGDLFTGGISNFFSLTNYQYNAFFTNNVDPIMYYDGTAIHYLNTSLTTPQVITSASGIPQYDIRTCLHVFTNRERLLLINVNNKGTLAVSTIFWSTAGAPLNFTNDEFLQAPTSEPIRAIGFINSDLIVRFASSERAFRYTGDAFAPFRFDSRNNVWDCDAPYSTINYDTWFSSVGRPGIVGSFASDSTNVQRVDEIIPDFTDPYRLVDETPVPFLNQTSIELCYGERFDDLKEGWLCYNSAPFGEEAVTASDNVLAFSYIDNTYAIYSFPFSCLGFGRVINVPTWGTTFTPWESMGTTWGSYQLQSNSLLDLAGDQFDKVYKLNTGNTQTVAGDATTTPVPVVMNVITANFNPFIDEGQLARLGYIDLLVTADSDATLRVQFYVNDQLYIDSSGNPAGFYQETILTFTATDAMSPATNQSKVWKRIYVGAIGKTHTIRFYQKESDLEATTDDQPIYIHAMVLYMKPGGRIFQ